MNRFERMLTLTLGATAALWAGSASAYEETAKFGGIVNPAAGWDHLWDEVLTDIVVIGVVFGIAALFMLIRYRAKSPTQVGRGPKLSTAAAVSFALIPAALFMADDFFLAGKGWTLWNIYRRVPANALEIKVTGHQWYFEFDYGDGVTFVSMPNSDDILRVPVGRPIVMRMTAEDVIHSFSLPHYRVKEDIMPGRMTYLWFLPTEARKDIITCTMFCGTNHSQMWTNVEAMPQAQFDAWLASQKKHAQDQRAVEHKG